MKSRVPPTAFIALLVALLGLVQTDLSTALDAGPTRKVTLLLARGERNHEPASGEVEPPRRHHEKAKVKLEAIDMWPGVLMACMVSVSMLLGATVILFVPEGGPPKSIIAFSFSLAAGVMVAISVELLIPFVSFAWAPLLIFLAAGLCCWGLCKLAEYFTRPDEPEIEKALSPDEEEKKKFRLAVLLFCSLTLHHFPEGFAVAISAVDGLHQGITMCIALAFHSIPEGIALAVSVFGVTKSYGKSFTVTFISGITAPLGAICAMLLLQAYLSSNPHLLHHLYIAVAGIMCYVAVMELIPEAVSTRCWTAIGAGFVSGVLALVLTRGAIDFAMEAGHIELSQRLLQGQV